MYEVALKVHGKKEHIGQNLNVKIVERLLKLVEKIKFYMKAKHVLQACFNGNLCGNKVDSARMMNIHKK